MLNCFSYWYTARFTRGEATSDNHDGDSEDEKPIMILLILMTIITVHGYGDGDNDYFDYGDYDGDLRK